MKTHHRQSLALLALCIGGPAFGATLVQTFESGENTVTTWGNDWNAPSGYTATGDPFLATSLGGLHAGAGSSSDGQQASRDFSNNTVGLDVIRENGGSGSASAYTVSMYVQIGVGVDVPASGNLHIINGEYGNSAVDIQLAGYGNGSGVIWQAKTGDGSFTTLSNVSFVYNTPYFISFTVNPTAATASISVSKVDIHGTVLETDSLPTSSVGGNVFNGGHNSKLLFHLESSAGVANFKVDNITITDSPIPEPASAALLGALAALGAVVTRRRSRHAA